MTFFHNALITQVLQDKKTLSQNRMIMSTK